MQYSLTSNVFLTFLSVATIILFTGCNSHQPAKNPDPNHTHADFAVWIDGQEIDFSDSVFMTTEAQEDALPAGSIKRYLHLHDGNGHVIHRHKPGLTIKDFFDSIQIGFSGNCYNSGVPGADGEECYEHPFRLFVNGTEQPFNDLKYVFSDNGSVLITNAMDPVELKKELDAMTDDACRYSKTCPWKGAPPTEGCIADPTVPCKIE